MPNPFKDIGKGGGNPFKKKFWTSNAMLGGANILTGGGRNLVGSGFKGGGASVADEIYKPLTPGAKDKIKTEEEAARASAEAEATAAAKQAEFEASRREGLERLALKRKRGFGASMIVNPTLGSTSTLGS